MYPGLRDLARELAGALLRLAAYLGTLAAFAAACAYLLPHLTPVATEAATARTEIQSDWIDVARPYPAFALVMSEFDGAESHYVIRRHPLGGRKDIISFGDPGGPAAHLKIEIYRPGGEHGVFTELREEIAARVADLEPDGRMSPAGTLETKFGELPLVDFAVRPVSGARRCLGFARTFGAPLAQIAGTYCQPGPEIVERAVLTCALDRLTFMAGHAEPKLAEVFAHAEINRNFCGHNGPILAATPRRGNWLDRIPDPRLRGRI